MDKISIVVPVYNVEKYVEKCINSIMNQTHKNIEVIIVDDGSKDNSISICNKLIANDCRFNIYAKENGGLSSARNYGMNYCTGKYIIFLDSDDYIDKRMIEILYNNIKSNDYDISICGIYNVYTNKTIPQYLYTNLKFECDSIQFLKEYLIGEKIPGSICNKLIKTDIARQIKFPEGKIYEDAFYQYELFQISIKYIVTTEPLYYYFHRENSITTKNFSEKNMNVIEIYTNFYNLVIKKYPELEKEAFFRLSYSYFTVLDKLLAEKNFENYSEYNYVLKFLKKNYFKIFKNKTFRKTRRIAIIALKININLYKYLLFKDQKINKGVN